MATFLQILGGIFLTMILFVLAAAFFGKFILKRKLRQVAEEIQKTTNARVYEYDDLNKNNQQKNSEHIIEAESDINETK